MAYLGNKDLMLEIAAGNISGMSSVNKFGQNSLISSGTQEDVWDGGGTYVFPATALITKLSQKVDQSAMRGETIEIQGLDASWDLVVQTKDLDASNTTTAVTLDTPLIRVFRLKVLADVVGDEDISVHNDANNVDYAIMTAGNNQTLMAIYTVPNGCTAYIVKGFASTTESTGKEPKSTEIRLWARDNVNGYEFQLKQALGIPKAGNMLVREFTPYMKVTQKTDIKVSAYCDNENGNVSAGFDLILVDN